MKALVIGSGGGEHATAWKLARSPAVTATYTAPGNYGSNLVGGNVNLPDTDADALANWAKENAIDLTVVGSAAAIRAGVVDTFRERGLRVFGPTHAASRLEMSTPWAKDFMLRYGIPTAHYRIFEEREDAETYLLGLRREHFPLVIKYDGPGGVKTVCIIRNLDEGLQAVRLAAPERRDAGLRMVIEEFLEGFIFSLAVICDATSVRTLAPVHEYRQAHEGDSGPVTAAMGAYSPVSGVSEALVEDLVQLIVRPTIEGMAAEGLPFQGLLSVELVLTASGPRVLEYGVRFGDTLAQVLLPRWNDDLYVVLDAAIDNELSHVRPFSWSTDCACAVVIASEGFPDTVDTGYGILGLADAAQSALVFHNETRSPRYKSPDLVTPVIERNARGATRGLGLGSWLMPSRDRSKKLDKQASSAAGDPYSQVITAGGRVLTVVGRGKGLAEARSAAYRNAQHVAFTGAWYRSDIGAGEQQPPRVLT